MQVQQLASDEGARVVQDAWQLRHIFSRLEENNLFLIQTAQEAEEAAEAATAKLKASAVQVTILRQSALH